MGPRFPRRDFMDKDKIIWLHISDLHLRSSYDGDIVLDKLLEDITNFLINNSFNLDFIVLSGDISYSSKPEEYKIAFKFLDKLLEITHLDKNKLFLVPGNHDVDRGAISPGAQSIRKNLKSRDDINNLLANDDDRSLMLKRLHNYSQFIEDYIKENIIFNNSKYYYLKKIRVNDLEISIVGLNSAWLSGSNEDQGKLALGEKQVRSALQQVENSDITIAIMHHPIGWLLDVDKSSVEPILYKKCDFILHGHLHEQNLNQINAPGRASTIIAAGASFEKRLTHNSYNFVQLDLKTCEGTIYLRTYSDKDSGFWTKDTLTYSEAPDGNYKFPLSKKICRSSQKPDPNLSMLPESSGKNSESNSIGIPLSPKPYFAHFFHLQSNFTGRIKECEILNDWLIRVKQPIMVLYAIGGMGKSSLAWFWLKEKVNHALFEGVLWWSFYEGEASFSRFLEDAIIYISGKTIDSKNVRSNYEKCQILICLLQERRFLLILDGFERQLGTYDIQRMSSDEEDKIEERSCIDHHAGIFLRDLAASYTNSKILITSRIKIRDLEDDFGNPFDGCLEEELNSFDPEDAFDFMKSQGVINGTHKEILQACESYGYHPLSLRLLSGYIRKDLRNPGDILIAPRYDDKIYLNLKARRHHIIEIAFNSLTKKLQRLLSIAAAFRNTIDYDALMIFYEYSDESEYEQDLRELIDYGLLLFNEDNKHFDLHPIIRRYAYERLSNKADVHKRLRDYFQNDISLPDKVQSLKDISPLIEVYYHTAKGGLYAEAAKIYLKSLSNYLFYRFGSYQTIIELIKLLFKDQNDKLPELEGDSQKVSILNHLAGAYDRLGYSRLAVDKLNAYVELVNEKRIKERFSIRINMTNCFIQLGELKKAELNLRPKNKRGLNIQDQAVLRMENANIIMLKGQFARASFELNESIKIFKKLNNTQGLCIALSDRARLCILMGRYEEAFKASMESLKNGEKETKSIKPVEENFIRANWLIGQTLIYRAYEATLNRDILLENAESYLREALSHCRKINSTLFEPDILLSFAMWYDLMGAKDKAKETAEEALYISKRHEYRLKMAEIYNFLAKIALETHEMNKSFNYSQEAINCAICDGIPYCYKPALDIAKNILDKIADKITPEL